MIRDDIKALISTLEQARAQWKGIRQAIKKDRQFVFSWEIDKHCIMQADLVIQILKGAVGWEETDANGKECKS